VRRAPRRLALRLRVRRAPDLGHHRHAGLTDEQPPDECHEPPHADGVAGRQQVVGSLGAQPVGQRDAALEVTRVEPSERRQLMDDHVRPRPAHGLRDPIGIECVGDHGHRPQLLEHRLLRLAARHAGTS
jgi:hypothetical protein